MAWSQKHKCYINLVAARWGISKYLGTPEIRLAGDIPGVDDIPNLWLTHSFSWISDISVSVGQIPILSLWLLLVSQSLVSSTSFLVKSHFFSRLQEPMMSRAEFFAASPVINCARGPRDLGEQWPLKPVEHTDVASSHSQTIGIPIIAIQQTSFWLKP